jgi:hypothetical protein
MDKPTRHSTRPTLTLHLNAAGMGEVLLDGKEIPVRAVTVEARLGEATIAILEFVGVNVDVDAPVDALIDKTTMADQSHEYTELS